MSIKERLNLFVIYLKSFIPTRLPVGVTEFHNWAEDILKLVGPVADENSMKWAMAMCSLHLGEIQCYVSKQYFVRKLLKSANNQVVSHVMNEIKLKQQQQVEQQQAAGAGSPPSSTPVVSDSNEKTT